MHHHWLAVLSVFSTLLLANLATPLVSRWGDMRVMHTWNTTPADWESLGPPPAGTTINLHIALKPHRENALVDALYEVSDPRHQKYGKHLNKEQVAEIVAPHQDTLEIVHSWLEHHGVPSSSISTSHGGGWLTITDIPVSQADELLSASYQIYRHTGTNETKTILRTVGYALPGALHAHVQTVAPTTHFASPRTPFQTLRKRSSEETAAVVNATSGVLEGVLSRRDGHVTPPFLRWLYKTQAYVPVAMGSNPLGILGLLNDYPSQTDLTRFTTDFRADAEAATFSVVQVNGGFFDTSRPGSGANLHMQYTEAMAYPTPHIFYNTGGDFQIGPRGPFPGDAYLEWLNYLLALPDDGIPRTISASYPNPEMVFSGAYVRALCDLFATLGLRGVSILAASGDDGVGAMRDCIDRLGRSKFVAMFPASCPWVTSVGGTASHEPEIGTAFSGGGFSRHFKRPPYQYERVRTYLELLGVRTYKDLYDRKGRGIPDISSQGMRFAHYRDGVLYEVSGSLCSTSTVVGIVALLNDYQISRGRDPLGFLNLWLYEIDPASQTGFNDITSGKNPGCGTEGFSATAGWDPVTGLGTFNFEQLQRSLDARAARAAAATQT